MSIKKKLAAGLVAGAVSLAIAHANTANAETGDTEKCYGVAKAGANDCGAADKSHSCMGHATADGAANEWVAVPKGLCEKLVGGSLTAGEGGDAAKAGCEAKHGCEGHDKAE